MKKNKLKIDLGCGRAKTKGFKGVDITKNGTKADIVHDLFQFPWPFKDNSVEEFVANYIVEYIPRGGDDPISDPFFTFMDEVYRALKPGGIITIRSPYYSSAKSYQDPLQKRVISERMFLFLNKNFRDTNGISHYKVNSNFDVIDIQQGVSNALTGKSQEAIQQMIANDWNIIEDLIIKLKKSK